jgi:hypothetical protein
MKNNFTCHQHDGNQVSYEQETETLHSVSLDSKRVCRPFTSVDMWFIRKNYRRRSINDQISYRF